jgi:hypothetical protein
VRDLPAADRVRSRYHSRVFYSTHCAKIPPRTHHLINADSSILSLTFLRAAAFSLSFPIFDDMSIAFTKSNAASFSGISGGLFFVTQPGRRSFYSGRILPRTAIDPHSTAAGSLAASIPCERTYDYQWNQMRGQSSRLCLPPTMPSPRPLPTVRPNSMTAITVHHDLNGRRP